MGLTKGRNPKTRSEMFLVEQFVVANRNPGVNRHSRRVQAALAKKMSKLGLLVPEPPPTALTTTGTRDQGGPWATDEDYRQLADEIEAARGVVRGGGND